MIKSKDLFMDERARAEIERSRLQKLGAPAYLTIRKEGRIKEEIEKRIPKK
jgi:hypothetical protein